jgi:hypothetical protein
VPLLWLLVQACTERERPTLTKVLRGGDAERLSSDSFFRHMVGYGLPAETEPMCFMGKINLMETYEKEGAEKFLEAVTTDRQCDAWYPYMPGLSPREHYEERQMQRLEQDRRAFETRLSDMSLMAQDQSTIVAQQNAEIAEESKRLVAELKEIAQQSDESSKRIGFLVFFLAIAQVVVGFISLYHESYTDQFLRRIFGPLSR